MEERVLFHKKFSQRKFLKLCIKKLNVNSLHSLLQFGFNVRYSALKNYYSERRLLPIDFFLDLCHLAKINPAVFKVNYVSKYWGQVKGGKVKKPKNI
jgi:hypothetical protein